MVSTFKDVNQVLEELQKSDNDNNPKFMDIMTVGGGNNNSAKEKVIYSLPI